jgi:L-asparaginase II
MADPSVDVIRGAIVESRHRVSVAVCDAQGALVAHAGDPDLVTFWRSAAKFFQAIPLVVDGGADALGITDAELAVACASHNGEPRHRELAGSILAKAGCVPDDLACGPHPSLAEPVSRAMAERGERPTRLHSNCSGKHAAMLAQARYRGWPAAGYQEAGSAVQRRCLEEVVRWTGVPEAGIGTAVDGCGVICFALPLRAMALAYARLAARRVEGAGARRERFEAAAERLVGAVTAEPFLLAGTARSCTAILEASAGAVVPKVGAEGVYCAALPEAGLGVAVKVEDGDFRSATVALLAVLDQVGPHLAAVGPEWRSPAVKNTRGEVVGRMEARLPLTAAGR